MAVPQKKLTYEEWLIFPDNELLRTELIEGEVSVAPAASKRHQEIVGRLYIAIALPLRSIPGWKVFLDVNLKVASDAGFIPDLIVVREGEDDPDDPLTFHRPPALVIEVVSDARRDLRIKLERYERFGVAEFWGVLPDADRFEAYRLDAGLYGARLIVEPGETISPLALPDVVIDVAEILAR